MRRRVVAVSVGATVVSALSASLLVWVQGSGRGVAILFRNYPGLAVAVLVLSAATGLLIARVATTEANREIVEREAKLRRLLAETSHELRTPLTVFATSLGALAGPAMRDPETASALVATMQRETVRLHRMINGVLLLARLDAVRLQRAVKTSVAEVVAEAASEVASAEGLVVRSNVDAALVVSAPRESLLEIVRNLLVNVAHHARGCPASIDAGVEGDGVLLRVRDEGPGMDEEEKALAFEPFFRGDRAFDVPGAGLGLHIVRRAAERAGGSAFIDSARGLGTTVSVRLPRA